MQWASQQPLDRPPTQRAAGLALLIGASFAAGGVGSLLQGSTSEVQQAYSAFVLPSWAPPTSAFGIVWPLLYVLIGVAAWRIWDVETQWQRPLTLWGVQLGLNAIWPGVFFGIGQLGLAAIVITVLVAVVIATIRSFARTDRLAALLLVPYLAWLIYASALNIAVWWKN